MLPDRVRDLPRLPMADFWNTDWLHRSDMFAPLRRAAAGLPEIGWPDSRVLNAMADGAGRIVNAQGQAIRFVPQVARAAEGFEPRAFLKGEVQVRSLDWHDLFNALAWMTYPTSKAVINARHYESLSSAPAGNRSPVGDALTLFDEDGVVVLSSDSALLDLVREFRWKQLFWDRRSDVRSRMRCFVFGHALYHKALDPFIGLTGKAILLEVPADFMELAVAAQVAAADRLLSLKLWDRGTLTRGADLSPFPVLGVPGWWEANEAEGFYDNADYFRAGRGLSRPQSSPSA